MDVHTNVLRKTADSDDKMSAWLYAAGCVDANTSTGLLTASSPQLGFVAFQTSSGDYRVALKNELNDCIPFATQRRATNRDLVTIAADATKKTGSDGEAHPDGKWLKGCFGWKQRQFGIDLVPPQLWGAWQAESWRSSWGREVGTATLRELVLTPELVCIAGTETAKLRAAARHVLGRP